LSGFECVAHTQTNIDAGIIVEQQQEIELMQRSLHGGYNEREARSTWQLYKQLTDAKPLCVTCG
jgi:hypothetical protein